MKFRIFTTSFLVMLLPLAFAAEQITFNYTYDGTHGIDFSSMPKGPLKVEEFSDSRTVDSPNVITNSEGGYVADKPLTDIVRDAIVQGLVKGNAALVDSGQNMTLRGTIVSADAQIVSSNGLDSIQVTVRTSVELRDGNRGIWDTTLFGRGTAPVSEGMEQALKNAMDRTISGLVRDTYFQIEIL